MKTPIEKIQVLRQEEFEKTSTTRQFPIGTRISVVGPDTLSGYVSDYEYHRAGVYPIQQYGAYALAGCTSTVATTITAGISTTAGTAIGQYRYIVPQTTVAANSYFWGCVKGICTAAVTSVAGAGVVAGSQLKVVGDLTYMSPNTISQSTSTAPSTIRQVQSVGFVSGLSATSANAVSVYLYGDAVQPNQTAVWTADHTLL